MMTTVKYLNHKVKELIIAVSAKAACEAAAAWAAKCAGTQTKVSLMYTVLFVVM